MTGSWTWASLKPKLNKVFWRDKETAETIVDDSF